MSVANFIPELWSTQVLTAFRENFVFNGLVNRNYEGEIRSAGDTVHITTPSAITVGAYSGTVTYQTPTSTQQALLIDQQKYWAFKLASADRAQANVDLMSAYTEEAGIAVGNAVDADIAGLYTAAGLTSIALDLGTDDFYVKMTVAGRYLDEKNVPRTGRWVVMTPKGYANILTNSAFIHSTTTADEVLRTGQVGSISGFTVYVSNNLVNSAAATFQYLYGTNQAITFAEQVVETRAMPLEGSFHEGVSGLVVYGRKVVRPFALGAIASDET